jgi:hypothetical protein
VVDIELLIIASDINLNFFSFWMASLLHSRGSAAMDNRDYETATTFFLAALEKNDKDRQVKFSVTVR